LALNGREINIFQIYLFHKACKV